MQGRLVLSKGVLFVGRHTNSVHIRPYDLDGRPLGEGFSFRSPDGSTSTLEGMDLDEDRGLWVADGGAQQVRRFTLFGREVAAFGGAAQSDRELRGSLQGLSDLALLSDPTEQGPARLLVARKGWHRHALQVFDQQGNWLGSLRSEGQADRRFQGVRAVGANGRWICVCEAGRSRVQVFRDGEFHFLFAPTTADGLRVQPTAIAPLGDGRMVLASGGPASAVLLVDGAGRLEAVLAQAGKLDGQVWEPNDLAVEVGAEDGQTRLAVVDCDAERVQVFDLQGRCFGELTDLPGPAA